MPKQEAIRRGNPSGRGDARARRVNLTLDEATIERLKIIGAGNLSAGVRLAASLATRRAARRAPPLG